MNNYRDAIDQFLTQQVGERLPAMIDTKERYSNSLPQDKDFTIETYIQSNFATAASCTGRGGFLLLIIKRLRNPSANPPNCRKAA